LGERSPYYLWIFGLAASRLRPALAFAALLLSGFARARASDCLEVTKPATTVTGGTYKCIVIGLGGTGSTLDGVVVDGSPATGVAVYASGVTLKNIRVSRSASHGLLISCAQWAADGTCLSVPVKVMVEGSRFESNGDNGIKVDVCDDCVLSHLLVRHNRNSGVHVNYALRWRLEDSEVAYNGTADFKAHGCYCGGMSGQILRNRFHHNTGYGIHAWPDPEGTVDAPFIIQQNVVYRNGTGVIIGAKGVHVRYWLNEEYDNH
jgi:parallel beta helix pectate lyase-like protein